MKKILRNDLLVIARLIKKEEKVLDVGCGDGNLLDFLSKTKDVNCRGVELKQNGVNQCIKKGLSVIQGDANYDLADYPDNAFSTVILSQTIQAMIYPDKVIQNLIRIGKRAIVSFPNFGYWKVRTSLLLFGKMPVTKTLPNTWYNTPNLHMCTIKDLFHFCLEKNIKIDRAIGVNENSTSEIKKSNLEIKNLFSKLGIFSLG